jgi:hypothetical protein
MVSAIARLRAFAAGGATVDAERCDLCGVVVGPEHLHVVELGAGRLRCACLACGGAPGFRRVTPRCERLDGFLPDDERWRALGVPIGLAFFVLGSDGVTAFYPGPAGLIRSAVDATAWRRFAAPVFAPEVEALLVRRLHGTSACYRASMDMCFRLAGILRRGWRGLSGGDVWADVERFFEREAGHG